MSTNAIAEAFYGAGVQYSSLTGFSSTMTNADFVNVVYKKKSNLSFFERRPVMDVTIVLLRKLIFAEGSYVVEFISELVHAFFIEKTEEIDPFKLSDPTTLPALMIRNFYVYNNNPIVLTH